jgi:hypothetical protein
MNWLGRLLLLCAVLCACAMVYFIVKSRTFVASAREVSGTVENIEIERHQQSYPSKYTMPGTTGHRSVSKGKLTIAYSDQIGGQKKRFVVLFSGPAAYVEGDVVPVLYDPNGAAGARLGVSAGVWSDAILFASLCLFFAFLSFLCTSPSLETLWRAAAGAALVFAVLELCWRTGLLAQKYMSGGHFSLILVALIAAVFVLRLYTPPPRRKFPI